MESLFIGLSKDIEGQIRIIKIDIENRRKYPKYV